MFGLWIIRDIFTVTLFVMWCMWDKNVIEKIKRCVENCNDDINKYILTNKPQSKQTLRLMNRWTQVSNPLYNASVQTRRQLLSTKFTFTPRSGSFLLSLNHWENKCMLRSSCQQKQMATCPVHDIHVHIMPMMALAYGFFFFFFFLF